MAENTDHNDLAKKRGLQAVKKAVDSAIDASKGVAFAPFNVMAGGVFWNPSAKKDGPAPEPLFFCSYIKPLGLARSPKGQDYALLLEIRNPDGALVELLLKLDELQLAGGEIARQAFARLGGFFGVGIRARQLFNDYINAIMRHARNLPRLLLADRTGWIKTGGKWSFVLPDNSIGAAAEKIILQQATTTDAPGYEIGGTLADWNNQLARYCIGNSRLFLAVCSALAGPMLAILNREGGGLHLVGSSSCGKTTALRLAASVMGDPATGVKTLDATANALESAAALANDALFVADELGQAAPEIVGALVYKLASGIGRGRADQRGEARHRKSWRNLFLTSGETDIEAMMRGINKRAAAGQQLRLANIPAAPDGAHGIFEELHGFATGAALSDHIRQATGLYHGALFRAHLAQLVNDMNSNPDGLRDRLQSSIKTFVADVAPPGSDGQIVRVAGRFALLAAAGEYAARSGVVSWPEGEAAWGIRECFLAWLQRRGGHGPLEVKNLLEQFEAFLHQHGASRFEPMDGDHKKNNRPIVNRVGFSRPVVAQSSGEDAGTEFFLLPAGFREATQGHDHRTAARILAEHGWIESVDGQTCRTHRLPGLGSVRCYHVPARGLEP